MTTLHCVPDDTNFVICYCDSEWCTSSGFTAQMPGDVDLVTPLLGRKAVSGRGIFGQTLGEKLV